MRRPACIFMICVSVAFGGCKPKVVDGEMRPTLPQGAPVKVVELWSIDDFPGVELAQFDSVFWEPDDTISLRDLIRTTELVKDQRILEIGTGTGLVSLCCLRAGAEGVVATDINPSAVACAMYNADRVGFSERLDLRLVAAEDPSAYAVLDSNETFDLIISNPPWEDGRPEKPADFAFYDPQFGLLKSLVEGLDKRLRPGGKCLLAYGCVTAIRESQRFAAENGFACRILDDRQPDNLPEVFLPGMLLEISRVE